MSDIEHLKPDQWEELKDIRLRALKESPDAFLATYEEEFGYFADRWQAEFDRGKWYVCVRDGQPTGLLGVTREPDTPHDECFLEYIWVSPDRRREHVASDMVSAVLDDLRITGVRTVYLWVLDGNDTAVGLYERLGFTRTGFIQPLPDRPERSEERMKLVLDGDRPPVEADGRLPVEREPRRGGGQHGGRRSDRPEGGDLGADGREQFGHVAGGRSVQGLGHDQHG